MHIHQWMADLTHWMTANPHAGIYFAFLISFLESMPIIGTIIPGAVTMTAIGSMIGSNILPFSTSMLWIIAGAFIGDCISFYLGYHYQNGLRKIWPLSRFPKILDKGEGFFKNHGGKSIIIGRFFGPARSAIPMVAGILQMKPWRFAIAAFPSACMWAVVYTIPGVFLGALSTELPKGKATEFLIAALGIVLIIWLCIWAIKLSLSHILSTGNMLIDKLWSWLHHHHSTDHFIKLITKRDRKTDHWQLGLCILAFVFFILFLALLLSVHWQGHLTKLNKPVFYALQSFHNARMMKFAVLITMFGNKIIIYCTSLLIAGYLFWKKNTRAAVHLLAAIISASVIVLLCKHFIHSPRPVGLAVPLHNYSFPSGHSTLSIIFYILAGYFITARHPKLRSPILSACTTIVFFIGLSRLYLGAHWFTDVIGAWCLGAGIILITAVSYRRERESNILSKQFIAISLGSIILPWIIISMTEFKSKVAGYQLTWPVQQSTMQQWWDLPLEKVPTYRPNRLGKPIAPFNLQWAASLEQISADLKKHGWQIFKRDYTLQTIIKRFGSLAPEYHMPLLPQLFQNEKPTLLMIKEISNKNLIECRLWPSNLHLTDSHVRLWVGTVEYHTAPKAAFAIKRLHRSRYEVDHAASRMQEDLNNWQTQERYLQGISIPPTITPLNWSGKVLIVRAMPEDTKN